MIKVEVVLVDAVERKGFNDFMEGLENYRDKKEAARLGIPQPAAAVVNPLESAGGGANSPAEVVGHIEPEIKYEDLEKQFMAWAGTRLAKARELLTEFGINRLPELPAEKFAAFTARLVD